MMQAMDEIETPRRNGFANALHKSKEWIVDNGSKIFGGVTSGRANTIFYGLLVVLSGLIVAMFVVDTEDAENFALQSENGGFIQTIVEGKIPSEDLLQPVPTGVNIVIVGDSISRYGYLSLVYFLRWGRWFDPTLERSNLVSEISFKSLFHNDNFGEFFFQTSRMLQPYELCDCYKETTNASETHIENRYYHDPVLNNTVTFLHAYGHQHAIHGRINANEAFNIKKWDWHREEKHLVTHEKTDLEWEYTNWDQMVEHYISNLNPSPDFIVANAGQWSNKFGLGGEEISRNFSSSLKTLNATSIWKTTTFGSDGTPFRPENSETDSYMCNLIGRCFNVSWTQNVMPELYWDERHFFEPVYRAINEEMLQEMRYLPRGYSKIRRDKVLMGYGPEIAKDAYPEEEKGDEED